MNRTSVLVLMVDLMLFATLVLSVAGCATIARNQCEETYCAHVEPVESCEHIDDLVPICIEDRVEYYSTFVGWWAGFADGVVQLGKAVAL